MARASDRFRHEVHEALDLWVAEELIGPEHAAAIRGYYHVERLAPVARARGMAIVRLVAGLAMGLGLLSLAAANVDDLPIDARLGLAVGAWVLLNVLGYVQWTRGDREDAGLPFLIAGTFAMAGVAGTLAQAFQLGGNGWELWAGWATGALLMAWAMRSAPLGFVAAFALAGAATVLPDAALGLVPLAFGLGVVPLAYRVDSRALLVLGLGGTALGYVWFALPAGADLAALFTAAVAAWTWQAWHARRLPYHTLREALVRRDADRFVDDLSEVEGVRFLAIGALFLGWWLAFGATEGGPAAFVAEASPAVVVALVAGLVAAGAAWATQLAQAPSRALHLAVGAAGLGGALLALPGMGDELLAPAAVGAHAVLALTIMWQGLARGERAWFWLGAADLVAMTGFAWSVSEEEMVVRGVAFALVGVGLAGLGWWWERTAARDGEPGTVPA